MTKWLLFQFDYVNIGFWYVPSRLRGKAETNEWWQEIGKVCQGYSTELTVFGHLD